jgi:hypothetical protein
MLKVTCVLLQPEEFQGAQSNTQIFLISRSSMIILYSNSDFKAMLGWNAAWN